MSGINPDAVVIGAGLIGLATARELRRAGLRVLVLEREAAGRGASWAGAGMLLAEHTPPGPMRPAALASAAMYATFAAAIEEESGLPTFYNPCGTIVLGDEREPLPTGCQPLSGRELARIEPGLAPWPGPAGLLAGDHTVDNRALTGALLLALARQGVEVRENCPVQSVLPMADGGWSVHCRLDARFTTALVVNAAGAWSASIEAPLRAMVRPRKGQMVAVFSPEPLRHVVHASQVYLVPRDGNRVLVGATLEDNGFTPGLDPAAADELLAVARCILPALERGEVVERWYGYRPCSADGLPLVGATGHAGYWLATAHFRDGILLTPLTGSGVAQAALGNGLPPELEAFDPLRESGREAGLPLQ